MRVVLSDKMMKPSWLYLIVVGIASAMGSPPHQIDEGSLKSALNAVNRKQRSLDSSPDEYYNDLHSLKFYGGHDRDHDDNLDFLPLENGQLEIISDGLQKIPSSGHWMDDKPEMNLNTRLFDQMLAQYLGSEVNQEGAVPSAFRERDRIGGQNNGEHSTNANINDKQLAKLFIEELQDGPLSNQAEVDVNDLDNFRIRYDRQKVESGSKNQRYDILNAPMSWSSTFGKHDVEDQDLDSFYAVPVERRNVNGRFPLGREYKENREFRKRYPVTKRSSNLPQPKREATDQKVAEDLGNLFGSKSNEYHRQPHDHQNVQHDHDHEREHKREHEHEHKHKYDYDHDHDHDHDHDRDLDHDHDQSHDHNYEHTSEAPNTTIRPKERDEKLTSQSKPREHPIKIEKKSVDWSQYFGIDRRKKKSSLSARPGTQDQDDEWLLQQYYKTMAKNLKPSERVANEENSEKRNMLQQIVSRLKSLEDLIIEEPPRYTNSRNAIEIQKVNDNMKARTAAFHSSEKMRRALSEFQNEAIEEQAQQLIATRNDPITGSSDNESDDERSGDILGSYGGTIDDDSCPDFEIVKRRCKAVHKWVGNRAQVFYPLCIMHQICRACVQEETDDESCDKLFSSASRACESHVGCLKAARIAHSTFSQLQPLVGTPDLCLCELQAQLKK